MGYKMSSLQILQGTFHLSDTKTLQLPQLTLNAGDSWAFVGSNGSGKSALARALRFAVEIDPRVDGVPSTKGAL
jgi:molybdate transport system ATP-binding protein